LKKRVSCSIISIMEKQENPVMMATPKTAEKQKSLGQIMTPRLIVREVLDAAGYNVGTGISSKKIFEPSCGNGSFLSDIVERFVAECRAKGIPDAETSDLLKTNVFAADCDPKMVEACKEHIRLTLFCLLFEDAGCLDGNIIAEDSLTDPRDGFFDFVVGNPPYVKSTDFSKEKRDGFSLSDGRSDMYALFIEKSIRLAEVGSGIVCLITPNSWLRNEAERKMRAFFLANGICSSIEDFSGSKVFGEVGTYVCITKIDLAKKEKGISVSEAVFQNGKVIRKGAPTIFIPDSDSVWTLGRDSQVTSDANNFLGKIVKTQYGVVTNCDSVFIGKAVGTDGKVTRFKNSKAKNEIFRIEADSVRRCVKGARIGSPDSEKAAVFPYVFENDGVRVFSEAEIAERPLLSAFISRFSSDLSKRDSDAKTPMWGYGRSQGLAKMGRWKLVIKNYVPADCARISFLLVRPGDCVYSGIFATTAERKTDAEEKAELEAVAAELSKNDAFAKWCVGRGHDIGGGYKTFRAKDVDSFPIK